MLTRQKLTITPLCTLAVLMGLTAQSWATTPAEMAAMSLQDLLNMHTDADFSGSNEPAESGTWNFSMLYSQSRFEGYQHGTSKLSNEEVLFRPSSGEDRTQQNYPVLPTVIRQEAYTVTASYSFRDGSSVGFNVPLISQTTHHKSVMAGYDRFTIASRGVGDISANYSKFLARDAVSSLRVSVGLSAPTGSIDKKGDTPRGPGDQQLPYTMQLGSGTWDMPISMNYTRGLQSGWTLGGSALAKVRFGRNDRDYRLGNRLQLSGWMQSNHYSWIAPFVKLSATYWEDISGQDDDITAPAKAPFIYPASITDPGNFGGEKVRLSVGAQLGSTIRIEIGAPVYQNLNGVQVRETMNLSASWKKSY